MTLKFLKNMRNAEYVHIIDVVTDKGKVVIPPEIIQDGYQENLDSFAQKIHFKKAKEVIVTYGSNRNGQELKGVRLDHLKEV